MTGDSGTAAPCNFNHSYCSITYTSDRGELSTTAYYEDDYYFSYYALPTVKEEKEFYEHPPISLDFISNLIPGILDFYVNLRHITFKLIPKKRAPPKRRFYARGKKKNG